jgi:hypothetical protein
MSKRVAKKRPTEAAPVGPHDWIFSNTAGLHSAELAVQTITTVLRRLRASGPLIVTKSGPGVVTIQIEEEPRHDIGGMADDLTSKTTAYKRMALVGLEQMEITDITLGKRDGLIIRMLARKGALLGVDKDVVCEVPLSGLVKAFTMADGRSIAPLFVDEVSKIGASPEELAARLSIIKSEIEAEELERDRLTKLRYIEEKSTEYADKNWGGW